MAGGKVTKRAVDAIRPGSKDEFLWDEDLSGFGLKVTPAGRKVYLFQYRLGGRGAPTRRVTIGVHGNPWTPAGARDEAERLLVLVKQGKDPAAEKEERRRMATDLAFDGYVTKFLTEYGKPHWRSGTYTNAESALRRFVTPALKKKALPLIRRSDISAMFDALPSASVALPRNVFALVRKLFAWAVERGDIDRSPLEGFRGPPGAPSRDRVLSDEESKLVWIAACQLAYPFGSLVQFLIATGQRREECAAISWAELNQAQAEWMIPASRAKNNSAHTVPLNALAVALLDARGKDGKWPKKGLVFTTNGETPVSGYSRAKARLDKLITEANDDEPLAPWRLHDLRRTLATGLQRLGVRFEVTEAVLNHVSGSKSGVAGVYQRHDWKQEKRDALDAWAAHIDRILNGADVTNVIALAERRA
ncbi:site-specific integrase [Sphingomonas sp.]|uniref:tyrosine-type recombinase/integrase n=1 Tax=Sphingomonas sp. TaxID=28214 RepID=UPI0025F45C78|nr:site-specific integrase [Sphingomonas sp.]